MTSLYFQFTRIVVRGAKDKAVSGKLSKKYHFTPIVFFNSFYVPGFHRHCSFFSHTILLVLQRSFPKFPIVVGNQLHLRGCDVRSR